MAIFDQFESLHQPHAANIANQRTLLLQCLEFLPEIAADICGIRSQIIFFDYINYCACRRAGYGITAESRNGQSLERVRNLGLGHRETNWHPVPHALGRGDNVRLNLPVLDAEPLMPGASPGGLNFVGDEVAAILLDDAECHLEIFFRRRDEASDTLNGLGKKRGDAAGGRELNHIFDVLHAGNFAFGIFQSQRAAVAVRIHRVNNADFDGPAAPRIHSSKPACK